MQRNTQGSKVAHYLLVLLFLSTFICAYLLLCHTSTSITLKYYSLRGSVYSKAMGQQLYTGTGSGCSNTIVISSIMFGGGSRCASSIRTQFNNYNSTV